MNRRARQEAAANSNRVGIAIAKPMWKRRWPTRTWPFAGDDEARSLFSIDRIFPHLEETRVLVPPSTVPEPAYGLLPSTDPGGPRARRCQASIPEHGPAYRSIRLSISPSGIRPPGRTATVSNTNIPAPPRSRYPAESCPVRTARYPRL